MVDKDRTIYLIERIEEMLGQDDGLPCQVPEIFYELIESFGYERKFVKCVEDEQ